jgi:class 3 adenylate cyclase/tetratricopeptide (TPR) repeat protein
MTFEELLDQVIALLQRRGRVTYRTLKLQFNLDDEHLEALKEELLYSQSQVRDEDGRGLAWTADTSPTATSPPAATPLVSHDRAPLTYTPPHLAEKILTSRSALEGERKQVTVLFCDITNSTPLAARLGPEAMHTLLNQFFELALAAIHRYEGTINQFLGDGFMALFGAPIAHEDHARRAVLAALDMQHVLHERRGADTSSIQVRLGLNTGLVVVGAIGDNLRMDYTAVGDTTNLAARLQQVATPGQIIVSEATHRLVAGYCDTQSLGALSLKGKSDPVQVWEVCAARADRTRLEVEAERGLTPFVGRERELRLLHECFAQARAGQGQVVFLVGEPGIGKSRLLLEFRRQLGTTAAWSEGNAISFGQSMAFHPLIDLLKRHFGIEEGDPERVIAEKVTQGTVNLGEDLRPLLPYLYYLLAVDPGPVVQTMDPQQRRGEIFAAVRHVILRAAEAHPQVIVFEDLQWMDQATQAFLTSLIDSLPTARVLCLLTYRTGYVQPFGERTYHTRIALTTLSTMDSVHMAQALLATASLPVALQTLIAQRAEGNPFFVEEIVKSLQDIEAIRQTGDQAILTRPLHEVIIPATIQDVIMARIDRLEEAPKRTLQLASVIGREFTRRLLDRLAEIRAQTETYLQELKALELIYERSLFPELAYMFKHALIQDVAYNSLLVRRRQELHHLIGLAIEELYADRLTEQYEMLAYHFTKAEVWDKALDYLLKAAEKAARTFATREALALYDLAEEAVRQCNGATLARTLLGIHQARADLYLLVSDFECARREGECALALARQIGDQMSEGAALAGMGMASLLGHKFDQALVDARQAITVAEAVGAQSVLAGAHITLGFLYEVTGRLDEARAELEPTISSSRALGDVANEAAALIFAAEIPGWEARFDEAAYLYTEGLRLARAHNVLMPLLEGLFMYGITLTGKGDYDGALALLTEGLALSEKVGDENFVPRYLNSLGWLHIECGDLERALDLNRRAAEGGQKRGDPEIIANAELNLGDIFLMQGDLVLAQEYLDRVYRLTHDPSISDWGKWRYSLHLFTSLGDLWLARGDLAKAQEYVTQCLQGATRTNARKYLIKGWRLQGEIALARQQRDEAVGWLRQAQALAQVVGNPTQLWKTHLALGRLHAENQHPEQERQEYGAAREVLDRLWEGLQEPGLRASLARLQQRILL